MNSRKKGKWSMKHDCCIKCGGTDRVHSCNGYCGRCYNRYGSPQKIKEKQTLTKAEKGIEIMNLLELVETRRAKGLPCLEIVIDGETKYLPFKEIPKKPSLYNESMYKIYEKNREDFNLLKIYYEHKTK